MVKTRTGKREKSTVKNEALREDSKQLFENRIGLLKAEDVAEQLSVSVKTVYSWARQKRIKSRKMGRVVRFQQEDVDELIEGHRTF